MKGLKVPKKKANDIIRILTERSLLNRDYRIKRNESHVYIPVIDTGVAGEFDDVEVIDDVFERSKRSREVLLIC